MQRTALTVIACLLPLTLLAPACFASGYSGGLASAWSESSIVVFGRVRLAEVTETADGPRAKYVATIEKSYKGAPAKGTVEFLDLYYRSSATLGLRDGSRYLLCIQTAADRKSHPGGITVAGPVLTGLKGFEADGAKLKEMEAAIDAYKVYAGLAAADRKKFLLDNLSSENPYIYDFIVFEVLCARVTEAIPHFRQRLAKAGTEEAKFRAESCLRCLGDPDVKKVLLGWLTDDSVPNKGMVIEELARLGDKSVTPDIRKFVDAKNERVAVNARSALLRLGEPGAVGLLLDMIAKSKDPIVRYNAIHPLNWNYSGDFTDEEKARIRELVNDKDPNIDRTAGFIVAKWKPKSAGGVQPPAAIESKEHALVPVKRGPEALDETVRDCAGAVVATPLELTDVGPGPPGASRYQSKWRIEKVLRGNYARENKFGFIHQTMPESVRETLPSIGRSYILVTFDKNPDDVAYIFENTESNLRRIQEMLKK